MPQIIDPCEASRQYQIALEYSRRAKTERGGVVSSWDEMAECAEAVASAYNAVFEAIYAR